MNDDCDLLIQLGMSCAFKHGLRERMNGQSGPAWSPSLSVVEDRRFYKPAGREPLRGTARQAGVRDSEAEPGGAESSADMSRKGQRRVMADSTGRLQAQPQDSDLYTRTCRPLLANGCVFE